MSEPVSPRRAKLILRALGVVVLALGLGLGAAGVQSLRDTSYTLRWRSGAGAELGPLSLSKDASGSETLLGADAVRMGAGLLCAGALLLTWSAGLFFLPGRPWSRAHVGLSAASLLFLVAALILIFPPWRVLSSPSSAALHGVLLLAAVFAFALNDKAKAASGKWICLALVAAGILLGRSSPGWTVGVVVGIFGALALAAHVALLNPRLRRG